MPNDINFTATKELSNQAAFANLSRIEDVARLALADMADFELPTSSF